MGGSGGGGGDVPLLTRAEWNALSTAQKRSYGLVAIQDENSGFYRGPLVNAKRFWPAVALRTNYNAVSIPLTNWDVNYSNDFDLVFKNNASPEAYGSWPVFLTVEANYTLNMVIQFNLYSTREAINFGWNGKWAGDPNVATSAFNYTNYYKLTKRGDVFSIFAAPSLSGAFSIVGSATMTGASVDAAFGSTLSLFPANPDGSVMDVNLYSFVVLDSSGSAIHDYKPMESQTYGCVLYDLIDEVEVNPIRSGATFVPEQPAI